ncbi:hypothetical protein LTR64_004378 [Lithohypha guttulata]|uniref:uncharacterized protein n=1 Tax=Lithohypha guttulata TaxID=1690604 RepID=UPI002DDF98F8|nr:hypothetical protein LTR51_006327 [Lithohypha guttulata]
MSPTDSPAFRPKYVPLPEVLPPEDERIQKETKSSKDKPSPKLHVKTHKTHKTHKPHNSFDTGYGSGISSPWSVEDRSPDQYPRNPQSAKHSGNRTAHEMIDGKLCKVIYSTKDGKPIRYVSRSSGSPKNADYVQEAPERLAEPYRNKYKAVKETSRVLQKALAEETDTARYNYTAAKQEEDARILNASRVNELESRLRAVTLQSQLLEDQVADAERKRRKAERKLERKEIEDELKVRREEARRREEILAKQQWEQIEASTSPIQPSRRRPTLPPLVSQEDRKPATRRGAGTLATTGYGQTTMTSATKSPNILASTSPSMQAIFEAQRDYDESRVPTHNDEDRRLATDTRRDSFYK